MLLLLIRHAQAAKQDEARYPDDTLRPIVAKGRRAERRVSRQLRKLKLVPDRVFSSPWKRAWQTARILVKETGQPRKSRIACPLLAVSPELPAIAAVIGEVKPDEIIALVGHVPWINDLASLLLTGKGSALTIDFPTSGVMVIETAGFQPGTGTLRSFIRP